MPSKSGIKIKEIKNGTGAVAEKGRIAKIRVEGFLNRGDRFLAAYDYSFEVGRRDTTAMLETGVVGMQVGGIGALAPTRKSDIARLGLKAMMAGTMANFMTAAIAGLLT